LFLFFFFLTQPLTQKEAAQQKRKEASVPLFFGDPKNPDDISMHPSLISLVLLLFKRKNQT
jgi:hypothetical protein